MSVSSPGTLRERLILWLWKQLPLSGRMRLLVSYVCNLRYAVGASVVITNEAGEVLLLRHTYRRAEFAWGLPGGWVKGRESVERAIQREVYEETSFVLGLDRLVAVHSGYALPRLHVIFQGHIVSGTFRPSAEVAACAFYPPDRIEHILPGERQAVRKALGLYPLS